MFCSHHPPSARGPPRKRISRMRTAQASLVFPVWKPYAKTWNTFLWERFLIQVVKLLSFKKFSHCQSSYNLLTISIMLLTSCLWFRCFWFQIIFRKWFATFPPQSQTQVQSPIATFLSHFYMPVFAALLRLVLLKNVIWVRHSIWFMISLDNAHLHYKRSDRVILPR